MKLKKQISDLLTSVEKEQILKGLSILSNNFDLHFMNILIILAEHDDSRIKKFAMRIIQTHTETQKDIQKFQNITSLESFCSEYKRENDKNKKYNYLLWLISNWRLFEEENPEILFETYVFDTELKLAFEFSRVISEKYDHHFREYLISDFKNHSIQHKGKIILALNYFNDFTGIDQIIQFFKKNTDLIFVQNCSVYLWKFSKLIVFSKLKELMKGTVEMRETALEIALTIGDPGFLGIARRLLQDPSKQVRQKAEKLLQYCTNVKKSIIPMTTMKKSNGIEDIEHIKKIMSSGEDFQQKIELIKNLETKKSDVAVDTVASALEREQNPLVIATYAKYLAHYGADKFLKELKQLLKHEDSRVVGNCLEGLGDSSQNTSFQHLFIKLLDSEENRVSLMAAYALWKQGDRMSVHEHLQLGVQSKQTWQRYSILQLFIKLKDPDLSRYVKILADDVDPEIRHSANRLLEEMVEKIKFQISTDEIMNEIVRTGKVSARIIEGLIMDVRMADTSEKRKKAAKTLSFIADSENVTDIYKCYMQTSEIDEKVEILKIIAYTFKESEQFLRDVFYKEKQSEILITAINCAGDLYPYEFLHQFFSLLEHKNSDLMTCAANILYRVIPDEMDLKIDAMLLSKKSSIRINALKILSLFESIDHFNKIKSFIADESIHVSNTAMLLSKQMEKNPSLKKLICRSIINTGVNTINDKKTIPEVKHPETSKWHNPSFVISSAVVVCLLSLGLYIFYLQTKMNKKIPTRSKNQIFIEQINKIYANEYTHSKKRVYFLISLLSIKEMISKKIYRKARIMIHSNQFEEYKDFICHEFPTPKKKIF